MASRGSLSESLVKILWARSGGRCALCREKIIKENKPGNPIHVGEIAHIQGWSPGGPRYNPNMTAEERNSYNNLILLCPTCHKLVDKDPETYTTEKLMQIKREHEKWVQRQLRDSVAEVTFAELEVITKYLSKTPPQTTKQEFSLVPPQEKIAKNKLSKEVERLITIGMVGISQVKEYLNKHPDPEFGERLRNEFVAKYIELKHAGLEGDALFYELLSFASGNSSDLKIQSAALTVLTYFFELCEVFEK